MSNEIKDIYDGLAILLVFVTILMSNSQSRALEIIDEEIAKGKSKKLEKQLENVNRFIFGEWSILFIINFALMWIMIPTSIRVIQNSSINLFYFNIAETIYIFICFIMMYFVIKYLIISSKLYKYRKDIKMNS